jgi:Arc/MetJ-type ribon-helix-helix transcriptional regulator
MARCRITVTVDVQLVAEVDGWVRAGEFASRSQAISSALREFRRRRARRNSMLQELARLDPAQERALAEEWLAGEVSWRESAESTLR